MSKKSGVITTVIAIVSLICSLISLGAMIRMYVKTAQDAKEGIELTSQYVMYIGTNDKDTYKMEMTQQQARDTVDEICLKYFDGYTLQEAIGSWTDEKNNITHEYTIVCYFDGADKETVYTAADEIIEALNQNTILIEENEIRMEYYSPAA